MGHGGTYLPRKPYATENHDHVARLTVSVSKHTEMGLGSAISQGQPYHPLGTVRTRGHSRNGAIRGQNWGRATRIGIGSGSRAGRPADIRAGTALTVPYVAESPDCWMAGRRKR